MTAPRAAVNAALVRACDQVAENWSQVLHRNDWKLLYKNFYVAKGQEMLFTVEILRDSVVVRAFLQIGLQAQTFPLS